MSSLPPRPPVPASAPAASSSSSAAGGAAAQLATPSTLSPAQEWLTRVRGIQQQKSPQIVMERLQQAASRQKSYSASASRAKVLSKASEAVSKSSVVGWSTMLASPSPQMAQASSAMQIQKLSRLQQQMSNRDVTEEEIDNEAPEAAAVDDETAQQETRKILDQLRVEPSDDETRAARFNLYEKYAETVESLRGEVFKLWEESKQLFEERARAAFERKLKSIDCEQNMGVFFEDTRTWFVHGMLVRAMNNNSILQANLRDIHTKVELLSRLDDCPICLEAMNETTRPATTLACCHKVCSDCWKNWVEMRGHEVCPLCRQGEFVDALFNIH